VTYKEERDRLSTEIAVVQDTTFNPLAIEVFKFQATHNPLYQKYLKLLRIDPNQIIRIEDIPFLPISFFKSETIKTGAWEAQKIFTSSGTTGQQTSQHHVFQPEGYVINARRGFQHFYSSIEQYCFLALLPSYLERQGSSLIDMAQDFIQLSTSDKSGFFLNDFEQLSQQLQACLKANQPTILLGVSFALLDFAEQYPQDLSGIIIMETGGGIVQITVSG
jgi:phenylacetate-coenzyme A ligase PaaK-like adenylate-forming protein